MKIKVLKKKHPKKVKKEGGKKEPKKNHTSNQALLTQRLATATRLAVSLATSPLLSSGKEIRQAWTVLDSWSRTAQPGLGLPVTFFLSPLVSHLSPLASRLLPLTSHLAPLACHLQSKRLKSFSWQLAMHDSAWGRPRPNLAHSALLYWHTRYVSLLNALQALAPATHQPTSPGHLGHARLERQQWAEIGTNVPCRQGTEHRS